MNHKPTWQRYETLRPDQMTEIVNDCPVVFWPLGLLEHHGWHLPVGLDGIKAERACIRIAERTGGVLLPTMWWGAHGGHGDFMWTLYQDGQAAELILAHTVEKLITFGFQVIVLFAGHYPWRQILDRHLPAWQEQHPELLFLWGTEMDMSEGLNLPGDHAAREETSYGMALLPEFVDLDALRPGHDSSAWPSKQAPPKESWHRGVEFDPADPLFAQMGEDARTASAQRGENHIGQLVDAIATKITGYLASR